MVNDERRDKRIPLGLKVHFKSATISDFIEQYSRDISKGGIFIRTDNPMPVGTLLKFNFCLNDDRSLIQGVGRVVWKRGDDAGDNSPGGMGIKFIKLDDASRKNLEAISEETFSAERPAAEAPTIEETSDTPSSPPAPIEPVRPQSVPKGAKRTMMGIGPSAAPPSPTETDEPEESSTAEDKPEAPEETEAEAPDTTETETPEEEEASGEETKSDDSPQDFLSDISSAIDNALDTEETQEKDGEEEESEEAEKKTEEEDEEKEETSEEKSEDEEKKKDADSKPEEDSGSKPVVEIASEKGVKGTDDEISSIQQPVRAGADSKDKSGGSPMLWIFLLLIIGGGAVYYFGFYDKGQTSEKAEETKVAEPEAKPEPEPEPEVKPEPEPEPEPQNIGKALIESTPAGAKVLVAGKESEGVTPLELENLVAGEEIEVEVRLFGYLPFVQKIIPGTDQQIKSQFKLTAAKTQIALKTEPVGASLSIEGKWFAKSPKTVTRKGLAPEFDYIITKPGFEEYKGHASEGDWLLEDNIYRLEIDVSMTAIVKEEPKPKSEPKAEPKPEPKPEPKAEPKPKPKPEPKAEPKPKPKPEPKAEPKPEPKPEPKAEPKPEPKAEPKPEPKPEPKAEPKPKADVVEENPY